jgi:UDP-N-acetylmuramoylalanine--D-glutamate ligase
VALIVGGQDRGIDYTPLAEGVRQRPDQTRVLTLPDSGPRITAAFNATQTTASDGFNGSGFDGSGFDGIADCADLDEAVRRAWQWAKPDGIVLLSPAAPSFGQFRDYRDRATHFTAAMRAL